MAVKNIVMENRKAGNGIQILENKSLELPLKSFNFFKITFKLNNNLIVYTY